MPKVACKKCDTLFYAKPSWIKRGNGKFCSSVCQYAARKTGVMVHCFLCQKEAYRPKGQLKKSKSKHYFCSKSCQTLWRNQIFKGAKHPNWKEGEHVDYRGILLQRGIPPICKLCLVCDIRVLCVHHRDQDRKNNTVQNLVWLCYNCHHLVHVHKVLVPI